MLIMERLNPDPEVVDDVLEKLKRLPWSDPSKSIGSKPIRPVEENKSEDAEGGGEPAAEEEVEAKPVDIESTIVRYLLKVNILDRQCDLCCKHFVGNATILTLRCLGS